MQSYAYQIIVLTVVAYVTTVNGAVISDASAASANLFPRQAGSPANGKVDMVPVHSVENLKPKTNPNAIRKRIRFGPFVVPGAQEPSVGTNSDPNDKIGAIAIAGRIESLCGGDCSILWGVGIPEFENGTAVSSVGGSIYNHHVFALNRDRLVSSHICPGDTSPSRKGPDAVINSQTDQEISNYTSTDASIKTGYAIKATDKVDLLAEFMNYRATSAKVVIAFDLEYIPGKPEKYLNTQGMMFSALPCNQTGFNVPTKQYSISSNTWIVPVDLTLINARGHQHDGGVGMQVFVNGKQICNTIPTYEKRDSKGQGEEVHYTIKEMSLCQPGTLGALKKGDALTIKSDYDVEKYPQRQSTSGDMETVAAMLSVVLGLPPSFDVANL